MDEYLKIKSNAFMYRFTRRSILSILYSIVASVVIGGVTNDSSIAVYSLLALLLVQLAWNGLMVTIESKNLGYKITSNSIDYRVGIFSIKKLTVPYAKITNATIHQSVLQRIFSVGTVTIDQEDSESYFESLDTTSADAILKEISRKSNVQPISSK